MDSSFLAALVLMETLATAMILARCSPSCELHPYTVDASSNVEEGARNVKEAPPSHETEVCNRSTLLSMPSTEGNSQL
ncbi:unnamed protein product [Arctogadus glacialis]